MEKNKKVINFANGTRKLILEPPLKKTTTKVMLRRMNITSYLKTRDEKRHGDFSFAPSFECTDRLWQAAFTFQLISNTPTDTATT